MWPTRGEKVMPDIEVALKNASDTAHEYARLDGEARMLEKMEKILFSELVNQSDESSVAKCEHWARGHVTYKDHVLKMVDARTQANLGKADWDVTQMKFEAWRTQQATTRAEMNLR